MVGHPLPFSVLSRWTCIFASTEITDQLWDEQDLFAPMMKNKNCVELGPIISFNNEQTIPGVDKYVHFNGSIFVYQIH